MLAILYESLPNEAVLSNRWAAQDLNARSPYMPERAGLFYFRLTFSCLADHELQSALTSSFGLDSIPTKKAGAPASSITSGRVRLEAIAILRANRANVKSIEDNLGSLDVLTRNLQTAGTGNRVEQLVSGPLSRGKFVH